MNQNQPILTSVKLAEYIYKNKNNLNKTFESNMLKFGIDLLYTSQEHIRSFLDSASIDIDKYVRNCYNKGLITNNSNSGGNDAGTNFSSKKSKRPFRKNRR